eukprot:jgi/Galph1/1276/GphlegSOOS_G6047.1
MMSTNKLDEFFSKKDSKKKKSSIQSTKGSENVSKESSGKTIVKDAETEEVDLNATRSSSSLAGLEKLSFLSLSSSSVGSWAEEDEKQENQPFVHTKGRTITNLRKEIDTQEPAAPSHIKEEKFIGWKTTSPTVKEASTAEETSMGPSKEISEITPPTETFPSLEDSARMSKKDTKKQSDNRNTFKTEERSPIRSRSKVSGSLRALLLESQQDKVTSQKEQLREKESSGQVGNGANVTNNNIEDTTEWSTVRSTAKKELSDTKTNEQVKESTQRRRRFAGLQAIIEEAAKDKKVANEPEKKNRTKPVDRKDTGNMRLPVSSTEESQTSQGRSKEVKKLSSKVQKDTNQSSTRGNVSNEKANAGSVGPEANRNRFAAFFNTTDDENDNDEEEPNMTGR